jgi:hypothetical protein
MNFLDDSYTGEGNYCIIEDHDMEVLEGVEGLDSVDIIDIGAGTDADVVEVLGSDALGVLCEVEFIEASPLEDCEKHYELEVLQKREINRNSNEKEKPLTAGIKVEFREVEMSINTSTVEEVIFKKHRVEIIDKRSRACIMEGVVTGYQLVGRVYDPDIVLEFEDGRTFYNENFGYSMMFYI